MRHAVAAALAALALGGLSASAGGATPSTTAGYRILLSSDRDGTTRWYSMRPDGSGLAPLLPHGRALRPVALSGDHGTIAYRDKRGTIYVSRASGAGLRRLAVRSSGGVALSHDGRRLAFSNEKGIWIVGTDGRHLRLLTRSWADVEDWSPDGKALLADRFGNKSTAVVLQPLHGKQRVLARGGSDTGNRLVESRDWSPDGRWIAYLHGRPNEDFTLDEVLWLVRPDGTHRHRVLGGFEDVAWSPDGESLAATDGKSLLIVGADGSGPRRLHVNGLASIAAVAWTPDGRHLVIAGQGTSSGSPDEIWISGLDGRGLRRLTSRGENALFGWTRLEPVQPEAPPVRPAELVVAADTVETSAPVAALSADGPSVAFVTKERTTDCDHVAVWTPGAARSGASARCRRRARSFPSRSTTSSSPAPAPRGCATRSRRVSSTWNPRPLPSRR
jgi:WD40-like Beta Propeller Repeat